MNFKKLTVNQIMTLKINGISNEDLKNWYYIKTENDSDSRNIRFMVIQNIVTNEIRKIKL